MLNSSCFNLSLKVKAFLLAKRLKENRIHSTLLPQIAEIGLDDEKTTNDRWYNWR